MTRTLKPGTLVRSDSRGHWRGTVLAANDPRAWQGTIAFGDDLPSQEAVDAHLARLAARGIPLTGTPVLWDFDTGPRVYWDRDLQPVRRRAT
jgi:hypothetical protein